MYTRGNRRMWERICIRRQERREISWRRVIKGRSILALRSEGKEREKKGMKDL